MIRQSDIGFGELMAEQRELFEVLLRQHGLESGRLPIPRRRTADRAPLSSTQRRLWKLGELHRGSAFGNVDLSFRLRGPFNWVAAQFALDELCRRHEILRTTFECRDSGVMQCIHSPQPVRSRILDLRLLPTSGRWTTAIAAIEDQLRTPFDFAREPLLRATWIRLGEDDACLALTAHHLALEGWGMRLLLQEFSELYAAAHASRTPDLPDLPIQYGDFAAWEQERLESGALDAQKDYWMAKLAGLEHLELPSARVEFRPDARSNVVSVVLSSDVSARVHRFCRSCGVTAYTIFAAFLSVLFHRYSGQETFGLGTTIANRTRPETERLIGNFGNNLFLRVAMAGELTFRELVEQLRETIAEARVHAECPLEALDEAVPEFDLMFVMRDGTLEENLNLPELAVRKAPVELGLSPVDLKIDLCDGRTQISGAIEFSIGRFTLQQIERMRDDLLGVIETATASPNLSVRALAKPTGSDIRKVEV